MLYANQFKEQALTLNRVKYELEESKTELQEKNL